VRASSDPPRCEPRNIHVADPARSLTDRAGFVRRIDLAKVLRPSTQDRYATSWLRRLECPARDLGHEHMTRFCFSSKKTATPPTAFSILKGLTCNIWTKEPDRFKYHPTSLPWD
jgi:hypothetical protein